MQAAGAAINGPCNVPVSVPSALRHRKGKVMCARVKVDVVPGGLRAPSRQNPANSQHSRKLETANFGERSFIYLLRLFEDVVHPASDDP